MAPKRINADDNDPIYQKIKNGNIQRKQEQLSHNNDIFNNPMINKARKTIPQEQQKNWEKIGEEMYNSVDFVDADGKSQTMPESMMEGVAYIVDSISSGMHISYLEENERELLKEVYGPLWYKRFGYTERDLTEIFTYPEQSILIDLNKQVLNGQK